MRGGCPLEPFPWPVVHRATGGRPQPEADARQHPKQGPSAVQPLFTEFRFPEVCVSL